MAYRIFAKSLKIINEVVVNIILTNFKATAISDT